MRMYPFMAPDVYCSQCFLFDVIKSIETVLESTRMNLSQTPLDLNGSSS